MNLQGEHHHLIMLLLRVRQFTPPHCPLSCDNVHLVGHYPLFSTLSCSTTFCVCVSICVCVCLHVCMYTGGNREARGSWISWATRREGKCVWCVSVYVCVYVCVVCVWCVCVGVVVCVCGCVRAFVWSGLCVQVARGARPRAPPHHHACLATCVG